VNTFDTVTAAQDYAESAYVTMMHWADDRLAGHAAVLFHPAF
jgi:hypothetical protein